MNETIVSINLDNLANNAKVITNRYSEYDYHFAVLKSDAYGHGEYIVNELVQNGYNYICVSYIYEALNVRKYNKDISILILEPISLKDIELACKNNLTLTVSDLDYLKELVKINKSIKIHLKLDTGMNRLGFKNKDEVEKAVELVSNSNIYLEGIYTHFATIGMFDRFYDNQVEKLKYLIEDIDLSKIDIIHISSSIILLTHKKLDFVNGFRTGILMYGYNVSPTYNNNGIKNKLRNIRTNFLRKVYKLSDFIYNEKLEVKPSMTMNTSIIQIKEVKKGERIGYLAKYKAKENMKIAILPIGYNNGIGKNNFNRYVLINNKKYYVIGEISMNMMIIKIDDSVKITDIVTVLGGKITIGELSRFEGCSISKMLLDIGKNNKKVYIKNKKIIYEEK